MDESIDTRKLRMFVTTVKEGSMRRASAVLYVTPSALSHGVRSLEESLGTKLFIRNGPALKVTRDGQRFFDEAQDILNRLDDALKRFSGESSHEHSQLHIGTTNTGCRHLFPGIVREFRESFSNVALMLDITDTGRLLERMNQRKLDIVIAPVQREYRDLEQIELGHDELVYVVHSSHPWAIAGRMNPDEIAEQNLIIPTTHTQTYNLIDARYRDMRIPLEPFIELNIEEAIKQLVSLNIGVGILPRWILRDEISRGTLHAFSFQKPLLRRWAVLHRANVTLSFPEFLFVAMTQAVARNLIE